MADSLEWSVDPLVHAAAAATVEICANRLVASPQFEPRRGEEEEEEEEESALTAFWSHSPTHTLGTNGSIK